MAGMGKRLRPREPISRSEKLAFSVVEFSEIVSISENQIRRHIKGELEPQLVAVYSGRKAVITREEGERWLRQLPDEKY